MQLAEELVRIAVLTNFTIPYWNYQFLEEKRVANCHPLFHNDGCVAEDYGNENEVMDDDDDDEETNQAVNPLSCYQ